jgi:integrase
MWESKRYRFYNGKHIASHTKPNALPPKRQKQGFEKLSIDFQRAINIGWTPKDNWEDRMNKTTHANRDILNLALASKLEHDYSYHYQKKLKWIVKEMNQFNRDRKITPKLASEFINQPKWSPAMRNNIRGHFLSLEKKLRHNGYEGSVASLCKKQRVAENLHKPFKDIKSILNEVESFDKRLHLCCLLAYGCLLRPHREIRLLTWNDINEDLTMISLSGNQNKGKRNRIVPIPAYIRPFLATLRRSNHTGGANVFTGLTDPYGRGMFGDLWGKFKRRSALLEKGQTLYSIRHTGAIQVYEKSGSLTTLQQVMRHSSLQVSLTYLRGLEVKQLEVDDMPVI